MKLTKDNLMATIVSYFFLLLFNVILMIIPGYLTLDSNANLNSRFGAVLLSILIPYVIVTKTRDMNGIERMLKFGSGYVFYIASAAIVVGIGPTIVTGLIPCLLLSVWILFAGNGILKRTE
jgi:uncharacterized membrane protein